MAFEIDLKGHRALVTGGGQGIGRGVSLMLASAGAVVLVNDLIAERCDVVVDEIVAAGGEAVAAPFDVTDLDAVHDAVARLATDHGGGPDILVNNAGNAGAPSIAGSFDQKLFVDSDPTTWERFIRVNFNGVLNCVHACMPVMIERHWGRIITIISDSARAGDARTAVYAGAKAAAAGFTRSIATEGGRHAVTANCIALATMNTLPPDPDRQPSPEGAAMMKEMLKSYVIRRQGVPDDVAGMVTYLSSELASWITGQTIPVNGGYTMAL
jgi:NAD(P)-dependent dehydrogenase (short-subunit alcohol dehydrogenase family)